MRVCVCVGTPEPRSGIESRAERLNDLPRYREFVWEGSCGKAAKDAKQTTLISTKSSLEETVVVGGGTKVPTQRDISNFRVTSIPRSRHFSFRPVAGNFTDDKRSVGVLSLKKFQEKLTRRFRVRSNSIYYSAVHLSFTIFFRNISRNIS